MTPQAPDTEISNRFFWSLLACIVATGLVFRFIHLNDRSFTSDEVYEITHLSTSFLEVSKDPDAFPPLFRWLLSYCYPWTTDLWVRSFPALMGAAVVAVLGFIGSRLSGNRIGINVAIFAAVSAHQIDFSQQCRAYSMYLLLVAIGTASLIRLIQNDSLTNWLFFLISLSLSLGTHYFAAIFIVQAWIFLFLSSFRRSPTRFIAGALLFALLCLPWIMTLGYDLKNPTPIEVVNRIDFTGLAYTYLTAIEGWTVGPSQVELVELPKSIGIARIAPWAIAAFASVSVLAWYGFQNIPKKFAIWIAAMLLLTPLLGGLIAVAVQSSYVGRYVAWMAIPLAILCGAGARWRSFQLRTVMTYLFIALNLLSTYNRLFVERYDRENYRALADHIRSIDSEAWVVTMSHYMSQAVNRELPPSFHSYTIALGSNEPDDWEETFQELIRQLQASHPEKRPSEIFLVVEWLHPSNMLFSTKQYLIDKTSAAWDRRISGTIDVYRFRTESLQNWIGSQSPIHKP